MLIRGTRLVPLPPAESRSPLVDVRLRDGLVADVAPSLTADPGENVLDADGRWIVPGLWDAHVHMQQWALTRDRLDVSGTAGPEAVTGAVAAHLARVDGDPGSLVLGAGYRSAGWSRRPSVAELDAVSGTHPVVLVSGDAHNGWLNSAALRLLGLETRDGPLEEGEWFPVLARIETLTAAGSADAAMRAAVAEAAARGVVGIADMELEAGHAAWAARVAAGVRTVRVRPATYPEGLAAVIELGLRTGDVVEGTDGLVVMGPLKVIFDGSLNTATAYCREPYPANGRAAGWRGVLNYSVADLTSMCERAREHGLEVAVHAIGDAAVGTALDVLQRTGARGSIEHAQLVDRADLPRFAELGVRASVQPAHLLDDRDVTAVMWPDRQERAFAIRSLLRAGATVTLGSDAPVAPLDPWLAMAAAVHRSGDDRPPWNAAEAISPAEALGASTDGQRVRPGARGDVVLLDDDPLAVEPDTSAAAGRLRSMRVAATVVAGRVTHLAM